MKRIHAFVAAGIAGSMMMAGGQSAQAQATGSSAEGGVGQITVTVQADGAGANCDVRVDGNIVPNSQFLVFADPGVASKTVSPIMAGPHTVSAFCNGADLDTITVQVQPGPTGSM
ncbi:hypothetical protein [Nocardia sp. NBC_01327]|uniref:hypothetical protein n=1 Tax=Nocardia sp. NBC_01327 TaxID=2903593 RepID=UPI002E132014|nr:hypothetical protein OG326_39390 [Nocardia sp. NBC_01327]